MKAFLFASLAIVVSSLAICNANSVGLGAVESIQAYPTVNATSPFYQQQQQQQVYTPLVQQSYSNYSLPKVQSVQPAPLYVSKQVQQNPVAQNQQQKYLDTQPEFTQAWADYPHPPGYLPHSFRHVHYQPGLGLGYVTWSGPINPQSFYVPVHPPYYYRFPPPSPNFNPAPPTNYLKAQPLNKWVAM